MKIKKNSDIKYVPWTNFVWVIGVFTIIVGWLLFAFSGLAADVHKYNSDMTNINIQLSQIQADLVWIKNRLK